MDKISMVVHSLPRQTTSFIGRHQEIVDIITLLDNPDCQVLTLWGPGGIGKTRLAIEIAKQISPTFADGVYYVALQPLHTVDQILPAIIKHSDLRFAVQITRISSYCGI
jgi:replication-associated recombination protein RarA